MISVNHIDHLVINTVNTERCIAFYTEMLGFELDASNKRIALKSACQKINVHPVGEKFYPIAENPTIGQLAFGLNLDIEPAKLKACRIENPFSATHCTANNGGSFFISDPDGNIIKINPASGNEGEERLACLYLAVADIGASIRFYKTFTGIRAQNGDCLCFEHGRIRPLPKDMGPVSRGSGDFCLMANGEIGEILDYLVKAGAPFDSDEGIVPRHGATGPIESIYLRDPDGNLVEISRPQSKP